MGPATRLLSTTLRRTAMPTEAPYGAWKSPITAQDVCGSSLGFAGLCVDKATSSVYLLEARPPSGFNILTEPDSGVDVTPCAPIFAADVANFVPARGATPGLACTSSMLLGAALPGPSSFLQRRGRLRGLPRPMHHERHEEQRRLPQVRSFVLSLLFSEDVRRRNASKAWSDPIKAVPDNPAYRYADFAFHPKEPLVVA
jgi:hypothetical protein